MVKVTFPEPPMATPNPSLRRVMVIALLTDPPIGRQNNLPD